MEKILQYVRKRMVVTIINQLKCGSLYIANDGDIWVLDRPVGRVVEIFSNTEHFVEEMVKRKFRQILTEKCHYSVIQATGIYYNLVSK